MHYTKVLDNYYDEIDSISVDSQTKPVIPIIVRQLMDSKHNSDFAILGGFPISILGRMIGVYIPYTDIDLFCKNQTVVDELSDYLKLKNFHISFESHRAITFRNDIDTRIQLVKSTLDDYSDDGINVPSIISTFDITAARLQLSNTYEIIGMNCDFEDTSKKILVPTYNHLNMKRLRKYITRGFTPSYDLMLLMATSYNTDTFTDSELY